MFAITYAKRTYAYICADTADEALLRAARIRHELELPMQRVGIEAKLITDGILSGAPWYSSGFFQWQDQMADDLAAGTIVCPVCGR